jgi:hypothetical protein
VSLRPPNDKLPGRRPPSRLFRTGSWWILPASIGVIFGVGAERRYGPASGVIVGAVVALPLTVLVPELHDEVKGWLSSVAAMCRQLARRRGRRRLP